VKDVRDEKNFPLHEQHETFGATFQRIGGWWVPAHYGEGLLQEYRAVRTAVGIADLSHRGKIAVVGKDRKEWLQRVTSNDVLTLEIGTWRYSCLLTSQGKTLAYFRVYAMEDRLLLEDVGGVENETIRSLKKYLLYGTQARLENLQESWGILLVSGPDAPTLIQQAFAVDARQLQISEFVVIEQDEASGLLARTEETGEIDLELFIPTRAILTVWNALWEAGKNLGLQGVGFQALESLRIEGGYPHMGSELNKAVTPSEAHLEGKAFSLNKGCYPGQEIVARMKTYDSIPRTLVGFTVETSVLSLLKPGIQLFSEGRERRVGWITSVAHSPSLNKGIALGYVTQAFSKPHTQLFVQLRDHRYPVTVEELPMVQSPMTFHS